MPLVVRPVETEKESSLQNAWTIYVVHGKSERSVAIISSNLYPNLSGPPEVTYVEGCKGSACRESGLIIKSDGQQVGFMPCKLG